MIVRCAWSGVQGAAAHWLGRVVGHTGERDEHVELGDREGVRGQVRVDDVDRLAIQLHDAAADPLRTGEEWVAKPRRRVVLLDRHPHRRVRRNRQVGAMDPLAVLVADQVGDPGRALVARTERADRLQGELGRPAGQVTAATFSGERLSTPT